ncbi:MAG: heavy metal-binding domain-containing protein [Prochloraceae cyanobacterium]|nr:heavy metal-binding domain-containing protein [Prochloraceae cyanobacterium]
MELFIILGLLCLGYFAGTYAERQHYKSIRKRERETASISVVTFGAKQEIPDAKDAKLFVGNVVISGDYFKMFISSLVNLFGGEMTLYRSLLDRGRREALLRLKQEAISWGGTKILNVRFETSRIGNQIGDDGLVSIEVIAYGTAIR